jgi:hypothetical protein
VTGEPRFNPTAGDRLATLAAWLAGGGWPAAGVLAVAAVGLLASLLLPGAVLLLRPGCWRSRRVFPRPCAVC